MQDDKALQLFRKVLAMTRKRILKWEATAEDGHYISSIGQGFVLKIWPYTDFDDGDMEGPISMTLDDDKNNTLLEMSYRIDGITAAELNEVAMLAKRISLNVDQKVDAAIKRLEVLEDDIPF